LHQRHYKETEVNKKQKDNTYWKNEDPELETEALRTPKKEVNNIPEQTQSSSAPESEQQWSYSRLNQDLTQENKISAPVEFSNIPWSLYEQRDGKQGK